MMELWKAPIIHNRSLFDKPYFRARTNTSLRPAIAGRQAMDRSLYHARVRQYLLAGRITAQAYLVAEALIRRANRRSTCWPSEATIAAEVGCSARSVRRHKLTLMSIGLLTWVRRRRTSCLYRLSAPPVHRPLSQENLPFRNPSAKESAQELSPALAGALARLGAAMGVAAGDAMPWLVKPVGQTS